jgi:type VI secretion system secreted protein VgrG
MNHESLTFTLTIEGLESLDLQVREFRAEEALSHLTSLEVEVLVDTLVEPETILGKKASLALTSDSDLPDRFFHGVVFEASLTALTIDADLFRLQVVVRPRVAALEIGQNDRITQEKNVVDATKLVFDEAGLPESAFEWKTSATYEARDYITQFDESDYRYVSRLLAAEGIGFYVQNDLDEERVCFFDEDSAFQPCERDAEIPFHVASRFECIRTLEEVLNARSDKVMLRDYDMHQPATDLTTMKEADESTGREVYLHPGGFTDTGRGDRLAAVALERLRWDARVLRGTSDATQLEPGRTFTLTDHPRADLNQELLVVSVVHVGRAADLGGDDESATDSGREEDRGYANTFTCIPKATPYRPPEVPRAPEIGGTQLAFVTGPAGQELHGSENGQVKVRFVWDRSGITDDKSSTWLRVGQFALPGSMVVPRVGFEVLVDFEMGDNDRPFVVGHLYNGDAMPPYALPDEATKGSIQTNTTDGGAGANEVRFGDAAGSEELFINASYDQTTDVENDATTGVLANESISIGANSSLKVTGDYTSTVGGTRSLTVGGNQSIGTSADYNDGTAGSLSVTVGSRKETVGGDLTEATTGTYDLTVGGLMALTGIKGLNRNIVGSSTTKVGAAWLEIAAGETIGALKMVKADTVSVACGAAYVQNCASESVKAGGNETNTADAAVGMKVGGSLSIKATNINISGEAVVLLKIGGTKIEVLPAKVTIKSSSIKLDGVKELKSTAQHETT